MTSSFYLTILGTHASESPPAETSTRKQPKTVLILSKLRHKKEQVAVVATLVDVYSAGLRLES